jgi:hypothetical protein
MHAYIHPYTHTYMHTCISLVTDVCTVMYRDVMSAGFFLLFVPMVRVLTQHVFKVLKD